jgi:hypothetical protein
MIICLLIAIIPSSSAFAQVQDMALSVQQFKTINKAKDDVKRIKKGITSEADIIKMFGKESILIKSEEPITKKDEAEFKDFLLKHIPVELKPEYPLPKANQKILIYIIPWTFEHPVTSRSMEGKFIQTENLVLLVTINDKSAIADDFKSFDFYFNRKWEDNNPRK